MISAKAHYEVQVWSKDQEEWVYWCFASPSQTLSAESCIEAAKGFQDYYKESGAKFRAVMVVDPEILWESDELP